MTIGDNKSKLFHGTHFKISLVVLTPMISANTIGSHYGKHHKAYFDNINKLIAGSEIAEQPLSKIVTASALKQKIEASFASVEACKKELASATTSQFGSGWAWLMAKSDQFKVIETGNADTPLTKGMKPLLTIDVWEHAYYIDYENRRADYVNAVVDKLLNGGFAASNLGMRSGYAIGHQSNTSRGLNKGLLILSGRVRVV